MISACVCFAVCTVAKGAPNIFGVYYVFVENPDFDTLPENDLFLYAPCSAADLHAGDYVAVKTVRGASVAVCIDIDDRDNYIALTFSDKGGVGAVPASALLGKIAAHNPAAGRVLSGFVRARVILAAVCSVVAAVTAVSLVYDISCGISLDAEKRRSGR